MWKKYVIANIDLPMATADLMRILLSGWKWRNLSFIGKLLSKQQTFDWINGLNFGKCVGRITYKIIDTYEDIETYDFKMTQKLCD
jgi:hypothetical protein